MCVCVIILFILYTLGNTLSRGWLSSCMYGTLDARIEKLSKVRDTIYFFLE